MNKIKLYLTKANNQIKKTPIYYDSWLSVAIAHNKPAGLSLGGVPGIILTDPACKIYAIVDGVLYNANSIYQEVKIAVDKFNYDRQLKINELYKERNQQIEEKIKDFSDAEKEIFKLLQGNLYIYTDSYSDDKIYAEFKGVSLTKPKVTIKDVGHKLIW